MLEHHSLLLKNHTVLSPQGFLYLNKKGETYSGQNASSDTLSFVNKTTGTNSLVYLTGTGGSLTVSKLSELNFSTEERLMLQSGNSLALNDFVIKGCKTSRTSKFFLEINGKFVCDYIADGLIISTPTGSTAYGLSAGGPVLYPTLDALVIVPVCPHTLNARPLVVPVDEMITVKTSDKLLSVAVDGFEKPECVKEISIKSSKQKAILAFLNDDSFYSVLRNKLHWGISPEYLKDAPVV